METTIGGRIRSQRKARGLSVPQLAEQSKLSESLIEKLERGDRGTRIPASTAFILADFFGCDVRWLVNGNPAEPLPADPEDADDPALDEGRPSMVA
jgi:transcriptional regulator with XRE-family HTH domain